jgi:hypothetical protein
VRFLAVFGRIAHAPDGFSRFRRDIALNFAGPHVHLLCRFTRNTPDVKALTAA